MSQPQSFDDLHALARLDFATLATQGARLLKRRLVDICELIILVGVAGLALSMVQRHLQPPTGAGVLALGQVFAAAFFGIFVSVFLIMLFALAEAVAIVIVYGELTGAPVSFGEAVDRVRARAGFIYKTAGAWFWGLLWRFFLLIVPGVLFYLRSCLWTAAAVLESEQTPPLERSRELTKGYLWLVFGSLLVPLLPAVCVLLVKRVWLHQALADANLPLDIVSQLLGIVPAAWLVCVKAVLFWHRQQRTPAQLVAAGANSVSEVLK